MKFGAAHRLLELSAVQFPEKVLLMYTKYGT